MGLSQGSEHSTHKLLVVMADAPVGSWTLGGNRWGAGEQGGQQPLVNVHDEAIYGTKGIDITALRAQRKA